MNTFREYFESLGYSFTINDINRRANQRKEYITQISELATEAIHVLDYGAADRKYGIDSTDYKKLDELIKEIINLLKRIRNPRISYPFHNNLRAAYTYYLFLIRTNNDTGEKKETFKRLRSVLIDIERDF